jgi:hypothetical protein
MESISLSLDQPEQYDDVLQASLPQASSIEVITKELALRALDGRYPEV